MRRTRFGCRRAHAHAWFLLLAVGVVAVAADVAGAASTATFIPAPEPLSGLFGQSIAIDGDRMVVGAPSTTPQDNGSTDEGQIGIYDRQPDGSHTLTIVRSEAGNLYSGFGSQIALDGDRIVGIVWGVDLQPATITVLDRRADGTWAQSSVVPAPGRLLFDFYPSFPPGAGSLGYFGSRIALDGDRMVVGAPDAGPGAEPDPDGRGEILDPDGATGGAALVFDRQPDGTWTQTVLTRDGGRPGDRFGSSVALEGDRIVVGGGFASDAAPRAGSVTVFDQLADGTWEETPLTPPDARVDDRLGSAVAIDGDRVVTLSPRRLLRAGPGGDGQRGIATVFERHPTGEYTATTLYPPYCSRPTASVAADAGRIIVTGCTIEPSVFERASDGTFRQRLLTDPRPSAYSSFGTFYQSVAIDGDTVVAGFPRFVPEGERGAAGAVAVYHLAPGGPCSAATNPYTAGDDVITGTAGDDVLRGGLGNDIIDGGGGNDVICAEDGDDQVTGGDGDDRIYGADGNDRIAGGDGEDRIYGGDGDDHLDGGFQADRVYGGDGNDTIELGEAGPIYRTNYGDWGRGGPGNDVIRLGALAAGDIAGGSGDDELHGGGLADSIRGGSGNDTIFGGDETESVGDHLEGNDGNDRIVGGGGDDRLFGGAGDDLVEGGAGNDQLYAGTGVDSLVGGPDDDFMRTVDGAGGDVADGREGNDLCQFDSGDIILGCGMGG